MNKSNTSIVIIENDTLLLQTGLTSRQFAHAKMGQYITEPGIIVSPTQKDNYTTEDFRFTESKTITSQKGDEIVLYFNGIKGKTLLSVLEENSDTQENLAILENLNMCLEWSFKNNILISNCGPLGIIILDNKSFLFLPVALFERSIFAQEEAISSSVYGCWINASLSHIDGWRFSLSSYIYAILSGDKPYKELNSEKRVEDYYDNYFLPLDLCVLPQDEKSINLANIVNKNLSLTKDSHTSIKPIKTKSTARTLLAEKKLSRSMAFVDPLYFLQESENVKNMNEKRVDFQNKQKKRIQTTRFFRKHKTKIAVLSTVSIIIGISAFSIIQTLLSKPTTEGMNAVEVVTTFYDAVTRLDSDTLTMTGTKSALKDYSNMVATLYVSSRMREAYEHINPILPPSQWIGTDVPSSLYLFGLTNIVIEQIGNAIEQPLDGDRAEFNITFYTLVNHGLDIYEITSTHDTLILEFHKKAWQIINVDTTRKIVQVDSEQFINDLQTQRDKIRYNKNITIENQGLELAKALRPTYPWIPSEHEIAREVQLIPLQLLKKEP